MDEKQLKENLQNMSGGLDGKDNAGEIIRSMLQHIGSTDPELRDELIYATLTKGIIDQRMTDDRLREILTKVLDETHLFHGLGETESDTVFTRSFSILIVAVILYNHNQLHPFLSKKNALEVHEKVIQYASRENDLRGFVAQKGWAHAAAHLADCLDELAQCRYLGEAQLKQILDVIQTKVKCKGAVYAFGEDERLVTPVIAVLNRDLIGEKQMADWLRGFADFEKPSAWPEDYWLVDNVKTFIRSLYFRTLEDEKLREINQQSLNVLEELRRKLPQY